MSFLHNRLMGNKLDRLKRLIWPLQLTKHYILLYFLIGFVTYGVSLSDRFLWDDEDQIQNNILVHSLDNIPQIFLGSSFNSGGARVMSGIYYKPLMSTCYTLLWSLFGENPLPFHLFQLLLHLAITVLLAQFFLRYFAPPIALTLPLVFLIHPMNSECVLYCADLQDVLFMFFGMIALTTIGRKSAELSLKKSVLIFLFILASLFSKESGILFVVTLGIYALLLERKLFWKILTPVGLALVTYLAFRFAMAGLTTHSGDLQPISKASFLERLQTLPQIIFFYFRQFVFPFDLSIAQQWVVHEPTFNNFTLPLLFVLSLGAGLIALGIRRQDKVLWFFIAWLAVGLGLHAQIVPLDQTVAERWFYFPMVGLLGILGAMAGTVKRTFAKKIFAVLMIPVLAGCGVRSFMRSQDWQNGLRLFTHDVIDNPEAFDLQNNAGVELFRTGDLEQAKLHFEKSIALMPSWWNNWNNLGAVYERLGNSAKAEELYKHTVDTSGYYLAYENYAKILWNHGKRTEACSFINSQGLQMLPNNETLGIIANLCKH